MLELLRGEVKCHVSRKRSFVCSFVIITFIITFTIPQHFLSSSKRVPSTPPVPSWFSFFSGLLSAPFAAASVALILVLVTSRRFLLCVCLCLHAHSLQVCSLGPDNSTSYASSPYWRFHRCQKGRTHSSWICPYWCPLAACSAAKAKHCTPSRLLPAGTPASHLPTAFQIHFLFML